MHKMPIKYLLSGDQEFINYDSDEIMKFLNQMNPQNSIIILVSPDFDSESSSASNKKT